MVYNQYIIETEYPFYTDLEPLFLQRGKDISGIKTTYLGHQFDVTESDLINWKKIKEWTLGEIRSKGVEEIKLLQAWGIDYQDGGYQTMHRHGNRGRGTLGVVISLDDQPDENKTGVLYAINNDVYTDFKPCKGKAVIITGGIWHGVYPSKNPRRTVVIDYQIKGVRNAV